MEVRIKYIILIISLVILIPEVQAQKGCCSHHGGVAGCSSDGRQICNDGTYSPTCTCTPIYNYGCTDPKANNYNSSANKDDGSCNYNIYGCTDPKANNYNSNANKDDGNCKYNIYGCTDSKAKNYNKDANTSDNSCLYEEIVTENTEIEYKIEYKENSKLKYKEEKVIKKGKNGQKQITYKIITNESSEEISKEIVEETIINDPVNEVIETNTIKSTIEKKEDSSTFPFIASYLIFMVINIINKIKNKNPNTIIGKIKNKKILYLPYYILIIPTYIDIISITFEKIYNLRKQKIIK